MKNIYYSKSQTRKDLYHTSQNVISSRYSKESRLQKIVINNRIKKEPLYQPLFLPLDRFVEQGLEVFPYILDSVLPLSRLHRLDLPNAIHDLSVLLTSERRYLHKSYWSSPRFTSAYLWYFLPWNLIRLTHLFSSLSLPAPSENMTIMDLGSGPLTLPLALWLTQPSWRQSKLTCICVDISPRPMTLGFEIFKKLALKLGIPLTWRIEFKRDTYLRALSKRSSLQFFMSGNVLNELKDTSGKFFEEYIKKVTSSIHRGLHPCGSALFVEPGTRFCGKLMSTLRNSAFEEDLISTAPCTHMMSCPLSKGRTKSWCHISFDAKPPEWLSNLAQLAKLSKDTLSLSFQHVQHKNYAMKTLCASDNEVLRGRVLSEAFFVPDMGQARYVCTARGLAIIPHAHNIPFGSLVICKVPRVEQRDIHSGALKLEWISVTTDK